MNKPCLKIIKYSTILLATLAIPELPIAPTISPAAWAQSSSTTATPLLPESILPSSIPSGSVIRINSSPSMDAANQSLKQFLEGKYPGVTVEIVTTNSDEAIAAVEEGKTSLAAIGRPLTSVEAGKGLVIAPIEREKIAIIVGSGNAFAKNLTFAQFARIFRGEITDWSEVGGEPGKIRLIDRPETNDARRSLSLYKVFAGQPFQTGSTATQLTEDDTQATIKALGTDGISYAPANQVSNVEGVKIIAMHETLPDDPRYPYSHPRGYVYKQGQPLFAAATAPSATATPPETVAPTPAETVAPAPTASPVPANNPGDRQGLPWWLIPLVGLPLLGGLFWLLGKGAGEEAAPVVETPPIPVVEPDPVPPIVDPAPIPPVAPLPLVTEPEPFIPPIAAIPPVIRRELPKGDLLVHADWGNDDEEMANLPSFTNSLDESATVKIEAEGTWDYGAPDGENQFEKQVDGNGNLVMASKEWEENDMRFAQSPPAALIALKNGEWAAVGKGPYNLRLEPGDQVSFVMNDQPHFYKDNSGTLQVKWEVTDTHGLADLDDNDADGPLFG